MVATSQTKGTITYVVPSGVDFAKPRTDDLPDARPATRLPSPQSARRSSPSTTTTGELAVIGGGTRHGARRQRPPAARPCADSVLVATPDALLRSRPRERRRRPWSTRSRSGPPDRAGPARRVFVRRVVRRAGHRHHRSAATTAPRRRQLDADATDLAFRVNRGQIVLNDNASGTVWDSTQDTRRRSTTGTPSRTSKKKKDKDKENEQQTPARRPRRRRSPTTTAPAPGRTTVLHPLDNDSAPEGRLLSIVGVDQPSRRRDRHDQPGRPDHRAQMPEPRRADTSFEYYIDDGRSNSRPTRRSASRVRGDGQNELPDLRDGLRAPQVARAGRRFRQRPGARRLARRRRRRRPDAGVGRRARRGRRRHGRGRPHHLRRPRPLHRLRARARDSYQVEYSVSDGRSAPVKKTLSFDVQDKFDRETLPRRRRARRRPR